VAAVLCRSPAANVGTLAAAATTSNMLKLVFFPESATERP